MRKEIKNLLERIGLRRGESGAHEGAIPSRGGFGHTRGGDAQGGVALIFCPPFARETPPLGISYLSAYLRARSIPTLILDLNADFHDIVPPDKRRMWDPNSGIMWCERSRFEEMVGILSPHMDSAAALIAASGAKVAGFSVHYFNMMLSLEMASRLKKIAPQLKTVFGGSEIYWRAAGKHYPRAFFDNVNSDKRYGLNLVDAFVSDEGEDALLDIARNARAGKGLDGIPGVAANRGGDFPECLPRPLIRNLDSIPFPDFAEFDLSRYSPGKLPVIMSRGCIGRCTFCNDYPRYPFFRHRSAGHVFEEFRHHVRRYGVREFFLCDLLINGNLRELEQLCDLIIASGEQLSWYGSARIRKDMTAGFLKKMRAAGCIGITYGVESFSPKILQLMNKRVGLNEISAVLKATKDAGIGTYINIVVGFPGEGAVEFNETIEGIKAARGYIDRITYAGPCFITYGTQLDRAPGLFGIKSSPHLDPVTWKSDDGSNTYEVRMERVKKLEEFLESQGLKSGFVCKQDIGPEDGDR